MTKEQFLNYWSTPENRSEMEWWLDRYAKEVIEDNSSLIILTTSV